jgi:hypothetical protein
VAATDLDRALVQVAEDPDDVARLVGLRAAIPELAARISAGMMPNLVLSRIDAACKGLCSVLARSGRALRFAVHRQEPSGAISGGERERALTFVTAIDHAPAHAGQITVDRR